MPHGTAGKLFILWLSFGNAGAFDGKSRARNLLGTGYHARSHTKRNRWASALSFDRCSLMSSEESGKGDAMKSSQDQQIVLTVWGRELVAPCGRTKRTQKGGVSPKKVGALPRA